MNDVKTTFVASMTFTKDKHPKTGGTLEIKNGEVSCMYYLDEDRIRVMIGVLQETVRSWADYRKFAEDYLRRPIIGNFE